MKKSAIFAFLGSLGGVTSFENITNANENQTIRIAREIISKSKCWFRKFRVTPQFVEAFSLARNVRMAVHNLWRYYPGSAIEQAKPDLLFEMENISHEPVQGSGASHEEHPGDGPW